jgi:cell filamentation protein
LAHHAGHALDLDRLDPDEMMTAMIASFDGNQDKLAAVIRGLIA